uniref:GTP-binding nuclear protein n=1 Tax=Drosophila simulans TaxID=7240 RepID=D7PET9_DROSI|nr:Ran-like protein [Drosophila simulans]
MQSQEEVKATFKLILIGDGESGKTTFVKRHLTGEFNVQHNATLGVEVNHLLFHTNRGVFRFDVWDTAGHEMFDGLRDGYFIRSQCAIIMFDTAKANTYNNVNRWHRDLVGVCGDIPIVICGNKVDIMPKKSWKTCINFDRKSILYHIEMSAKTNYNVEKPFVYLLKKLVGDPSLKLVQNPAIQPPKVVFTDEMSRQVERFLDEATSYTLPPTYDFDL